MSVEFIIDAVPPSLNQWSRKHWSVRSIFAAQWRLLVRSASPKHRAITPAIVTLTFRLPRGGDADNRAKFVLDGLVGGLIVDDGPPHLVELRLRSERGKPAQTTVRVEAA